jgi:PAS domain S-box-containing protein
MAPRADGQHEKLLKALIDIGQELASTIELDELLNRILRISREVFHFENAIIRLVDPEAGALVTVASYGYADEAARPQIRLGKGVMGKVAATGKPVLVPDLADMPDYVPGIHGARSELAVPLVAREKIIGVFNVESPVPHAFREEDIAPLITMAGQAAIAIENARLYKNLREVSDRYQELHQFNSRILKSANLGIYTVDDQMRITSWNPRMGEMSGVGEEDALGRNLFQLFPVLEEEGFADRIRRVLEKGTPERVRLAHRNQKGLKTLTGSLLSFSRARETAKRETDLNEVLRDVLRLVRFELTRNAIHLRENYEELPPIQADPNKLKQVFINLVMNASQAMGTGGTLTVRTGFVAGEEVEAVISDTGPGISEEVREHIFDPFFSTKREGEGTGLGLYICRKIISEHEGRLVLDAAEGRGAVFRVILPQA